MTNYYYLLLVVILVAAVFYYYNRNTEHFVPYNNETVEKGPSKAMKEAEEYLRPLFEKLVQQDAGLLPTQYQGFKDTIIFQQEAQGLIKYVLNRINKIGDRSFYNLDVQSVKKEQTLDPEDRNVVNKWTINVFIQEATKEGVHSWVLDIGMTLIQKGDQIKIVDIHTIQDAPSPNDLEGFNPNDKFYRIMNPWHLTSPWKTSENADATPINDEDAEQLLQRWHRDSTTPNYACFLDDGAQKVPNQALGINDFYSREGTLYKERGACEAQNGKWDAPVKNNSECPFYQANKNYPNKIGGVKLKDKRCEMPINTKILGYRYISSDPLHKPWCYNCVNGVEGPGSWGPCCDEQYDTDLYPNLGGNPDYAFPGDELERYQQKEVLQQRGLNWQKIPTHTKDILNQNQRQPVFNNIISQGTSSPF